MATPQPHPREDQYDYAYSDGYTDAWAEIAPVIRNLLEIARIAQYYAPGELTEFPEHTAAIIAAASAALEKGTGA